MKKLGLLVFVAIVAANITACKGPNSGPEFPGVDLALVAIDKYNGDLLDTTGINGIIDVRKVKVYANDSSKYIYFDGSDLSSWRYSGIEKVGLMYNAILFGVPYGDLPNELTGGCVVDWGNDIIDTLQAKKLSDRRLQLFRNGKLVWDNINTPQSSNYTVYLRRF